MNRTLRNTQYAILLILILAALLAIPVAAQGTNPPTDDDVNAVAKQLYCPVCENTPLDVCPTQACAQWRDLIRLKLSQGESEAEIKQYFVDNDGASVLKEPPREGLNWLAYIIPPLAILAGAAFLFGAFRRMKKPALAASAQSPEVDASADEYVSRLEAEVKKQR
ncbi:MAG: cytochrome c-type biogenesis protein CcmH [Chloroflexi bacterium]|nr:cytochrome c-type biogenesis protein CcmH [Chloroflexota bacterium]